MKHELKIWPQFYQAVADGSKTFEIRKNDRGFQKGDIVFLKEYDPELLNRPSKKYQAIVKGKYIDSEILKFTIGYVLPIENERVVFSLLNLESPDAGKGSR